MCSALWYMQVCERLEREEPRHASDLGRQRGAQFQRVPGRADGQHPNAIRKQGGRCAHASLNFLWIVSVCFIHAIWLRATRVGLCNSPDCSFAPAFLRLGFPLVSQACSYISHTSCAATCGRTRPGSPSFPFLQVRSRGISSELWRQHDGMQHQAASQFPRPCMHDLPALAAAACAVRSTLQCLLELVCALGRATRSRVGSGTMGTSP